MLNLELFQLTRQVSFHIFTGKCVIISWVWKDKLSPGQMGFNSMIIANPVEDFFKLYLLKEIFIESPPLLFKKALTTFCDSCIHT